MITTCEYCGDTTEDMRERETYWEYVDGTGWVCFDCVEEFLK